VRFVGGGDSKAKSGTASLRNVEMAKTAGGTVTLVDAMTATGDFTFVNDNNKVRLGTLNLTVNGSVLSTDANEYFVTDGTGQLRKPISNNGIYTMEVGDMTNYSPISSNITATTYTSAILAARVINAVHPDRPATVTPYLTRYWDVDVTGTAGLSQTLTGTYVEADDLVGSPESALSGAVNTGSNTVTSSTPLGSVDFTGMKTFVNFNLTAYIQGYMNGGTMRPVLMNSGIGASSSNCDNITIELRNSSAPYALVESFTGIIGTNGTMRAAFTTAAPGNYYVAIKHRNALETWSKLPVAISNNASYNFSTAATQAYGDNMVGLGAGGSAPFALYSGDIDALIADGNIDLLDYPIWETDYNNLEIGYFRSDLNGDGNVDLVDYPVWEANYNNLISVAKP
jgi:hypothetical protein